MINTIILLVLLCWLGYKFYKTKNQRLLYAAIMIALLQLARWPFFIPIKLSLSLIAYFSCGALLYEFYYKQKNKNSIFFAIIFFLFGSVFLAEVMLPLLIHQD